MSRQASGMSVHELRLPSSNSVTAYRLAAQPPLAHANFGHCAKSGCVADIIQLMRPILLCGKQHGLPTQRSSNISWLQYACQIMSVYGDGLFARHAGCHHWNCHQTLHMLSRQNRYRIEEMLLLDGCVLVGVL